MVDGGERGTWRAIKGSSLGFLGAGVSVAALALLIFIGTGQGGYGDGRGAWQGVCHGARISEQAGTS